LGIRGVGIGCSNKYKVIDEEQGREEAPTEEVEKDLGEGAIDGGSSWLFGALARLKERAASSHSHSFVAPSRCKPPV